MNAHAGEQGGWVSAWLNATTKRAPPPGFSPPPRRQSFRKTRAGTHTRTTPCVFSLSLSLTVISGYVATSAHMPAAAPATPSTTAGDTMAGVN
jgi:hypothetical protein